MTSLQAGGQSWQVQLGRRDSRTANRAGVSDALPNALETPEALAQKFSNVGLDSTDLVALSGNNLLKRNLYNSFIHIFIRTYVL